MCVKPNTDYVKTKTADRRKEITAAKFKDAGTFLDINKSTANTLEKCFKLCEDDDTC